MIYSLIFCCKKSKLDNYLVCLAAEYRICRSDFQHQPISNPGKYSFKCLTAKFWRIVDLLWWCETTVAVPGPNHKMFITPSI